MLPNNEKELKDRLRCEEGLVRCSRALLTHGSKQIGVQKALDHLREAAQADRAYLFENFTHPTDGISARQTFESIREGIDSEIDNPLRTHIPHATVSEQAMSLSQGEAYRGNVSELPTEDQRLFEPKTVRSILMLPVFVDKAWFGFIGFDDDSGQNCWSEHQVRLLSVGADIIGTFIARHDAAEALRKQKQELSDFARMMSHDFKNHLFVIEGLVSLAVDMEGDAETSLVRIDQTVKSLRKLLIRSLALANSGQAIERADAVNLNEVAAEAAKLVVDEKINVSIGHLPIVRCDAMKVRTVLENLLKNAVEHGKGRFIEITAEPTTEGTDILVINDGEPCPRQTVANRLAKTGFRNRGTRGLGLAIIKKIILAHEWQIHIDPSTDDLTRFRISIPRRDITTEIRST